jgi:hypothetical protein
VPPFAPSSIQKVLVYSQFIRYYIYSFILTSPTSISSEGAEEGDGEGEEGADRATDETTSTDWPYGAPRAQSTKKTTGKKFIVVAVAVAVAVAVFEVEDEDEVEDEVEVVL